MMNSTNNKKEKNWTMIGCAGLAICVVAYSLACMKVADITEDYRNEQIAKYAEINSSLKRNECERPIAAYMNQLKRSGISADFRNEIDMVDTATRDRCLKAEITISENKDKMKNAVHLKPSFSYITQNFFG